MTVGSVETSAASVRPRVNKSRRKAPFPNSVLDRNAFQQALEDAGISIKPVTLTGFYQSLHREHYPDLPVFVKKYHQNERDYLARKQKNFPNVSVNATVLGEEPVACESYLTRKKPLKNAVSAWKNRNRQTLPAAFLQFLSLPADQSGFVTVTSKVAKQKISADGSTTKLAIELHDGQMVESVIMRYSHSDKRSRGGGSSRASLCVSSQCGCAMGCTFCATGTMGLSGNLTSAEILEQIVHANRILAQEWIERQKNGQDGSDENLDLVRNVVFMGMGEPLDNYTNVVTACKALIDRKRWNLAHGRVTVSTVGLVSQIRKLTAELPEVNLALSLHAPNQELRSKIVPTACRYPLEELIDAVDGHMMAYVRNHRARQTYTDAERIQESSRRRAMIEYVMLEGETSSMKCAHELGKLCENRHLVVNLIPYNPTDVKDKLRCPSREHVLEFQRIVSSYKVFCTIRRTMGADIDSACGQLLVKMENEKVAEGESYKLNNVVGDIEDAPTSRFDVGNNNTDKVRSKIKGKNQMGHEPIADVSISSPSTDKEALLVQEQSRFVDRSKIDDSVDDSDLEQWIRPLAIATTLAGACCLISTAFLLASKQRRR